MLLRKAVRPRNAGAVARLPRLSFLGIIGHGTIVEEKELVSCMTGFRMRLPIEHLTDGSYRSLKLGPA